ncbi:MAG: isochorismate synthase [Scytolyngbya sp. HA4215-MV1]|jgi:menaquinone-specific isochorismate synthase|nr:isochorismate synthase [Scytolyngbya sp. HA4215-MV1]
MPVIPGCTNLFQDCKDLYQFLLACKQVSIERAKSHIVSISVEIPSIDPLAILRQFGKPDQLHFYLEKGDQNSSFSSENETVAIAAIGTALSQEIEGDDRFLQVKNFIRSSLSSLITAETSNSAFAGPHFFCGFTFFDQNSEQNAPFPGATVFLPCWQISRKKNRSTVVANILVDSGLNLNLISETLCHQFQAITAIKYDWFSLGIDSPSPLQQKTIKDTESFQAAVASALVSIQSKHLNKIVLAHALDVVSPMPLHPVDSLHHLRQLHPDCYVFSIGNGRGQSFIGASPERLVSLHNRQLATDALAGSAPRGKTPTEDARLADGLLSSQKELHEHQVVIDFITQRLVELGLRPHLSPRRLLQLSNIQHLQTPVQAVLPPAVHLLDVVAELHPTPAVAGTPRRLACEQIRRYENFERSLYAAPIGWVDHQGNGEFVVGIRSALVEGCHARLYAGAGIVAGSDPEREMAEVQLKLRALLGALV